MPKPMNRCICVTKAYPGCPIHGNQQENKPKLSNEELALSMFVFIEEHGERMIRAVADACRMVAEKASAEHDGTSAEVWSEAERIVRQAAEHLEKN